MKVTQPPEGTHQGDSMCSSVAPGVQGQGFQEGEGPFWPLALFLSEDTLPRLTCTVYLGIRQAFPCTEGWPGPTF